MWEETTVPVSLTEGDGRANVMPVPMGNAATLRRATIKALVKNFLESGRSHHTHSATTLWAITKYCEVNRIPFQLTYDPAFGYLVKMTTPNES